MTAPARKLTHPGPEKTATEDMAHMQLTVGQQETAQYVTDMILELRNLAKSAKLHTVMVPLEYAYYEAFSAANQVSVPPEEVIRLRRLAKAAKETEVAANGTGD